MERKGVANAGLGWVGQKGILTLGTREVFTCDGVGAQLLRPPAHAYAYTGDELWTIHLSCPDELKRYLPR